MRWHPYRCKRIHSRTQGIGIVADALRARPDVDPRKSHNVRQAMSGLTLISHHLCPYVQRAAIALAEKGVAFERVYVDLAAKPDWFKAVSPLGKVPVLRVTQAGGEETSIFESAVILEYLEETSPSPLHPGDALQRARHRGWIEFGSQVLNGIGRFYSATERATFERERAALETMFARLEEELEEGPFFAGENFSLVDAAFAPVFRYFD